MKYLPVGYLTSGQAWISGLAKINCSALCFLVTKQHLTFMSSITDSGKVRIPVLLLLKRFFKLLQNYNII